VALFDDGLDLLVHEGADGVTHQALLFGEQRVEFHVVDAGKTVHDGLQSLQIGGRNRAGSGTGRVRGIVTRGFAMIGPWPTSPGGSAFAMAKDIADGYLLVTERTYQRFEPAQLDQLAFEMERAQRDIRSDLSAQDDMATIQQRNRRLQRLTQAISMLRGVDVAQAGRASRGRSPDLRDGRRASIAGLDPAMELLRAAGPVIAALAAVLLFDRMTRRRGLDPPGFRAPLRRIAGTSLVAFSFYVGIFAALGTIGRQGEIDLSRLQGWQLFSAARAVRTDDRRLVG
jgi:hypothetical protein